MPTALYIETIALSGKAFPFSTNVLTILQVQGHTSQCENIIDKKLPSPWENYQHCYPGKKSVPGAAIAIQTFRDFLGFNPHGHVLATDGCFPEQGLFKVDLAVKLKLLRLQ